MVGVPIWSEARVWGVAFAATVREEPSAEGTIARISGFTELVAIALGNLRARAELQGLVDEQGARVVHQCPGHLHGVQARSGAPQAGTARDLPHGHRDQDDPAADQPEQGKADNHEGPAGQQGLLEDGRPQGVVTR